jgi:hypothetical protein
MRSRTQSGLRLCSRRFSTTRRLTSLAWRDGLPAVMVIVPCLHLTTGAKLRIDCGANLPGKAYYGVTGLALLFVVSAWVYSGGYPYIYDGNETSLSFVHALSLYHFNPFDFSFLTSHETEFNKAAPDPALLYSNNPNFPRYIHYLLLLAGIKSFTTQVLLITLTVTLLNMLSLRWLMSAMIGDAPPAQWITVLAAIVMVIDYHGFLSYTVNTYRTFVFCLLWLCLVSIASSWRPWAIVILFFVLFQLEYGFALFVVGSAATLFVLIWPAHPLRTAAAAITGVGMSLTSYFVQLWTYFPVTAIMAHFHGTLQRRGGGNSLSYFDAITRIIVQINGTTLCSRT